MADDLQNYKLHLQQVEAALLTDSENEEFLKLKRDLEEVIELKRDLIKTQLENQRKSAYVESSASKATYDEIEAAILEAEILITPGKTWNIGGKCQAKRLMWCCWSSEELTDDFLNIACKTIPCNYDKVKHTLKLNANTPSNTDDDIETVKEMSPFEVVVKLFECELKYYY
uniref:Uncharacterized protein n=1 Tax=Glossina austeni TaxID=7395 RepID=A0A1A9V106_GLOAU